MASLFRVKPYAHHEYKFVVRAKLGGKWKRRYFRTEQEAIAHAEEQNKLAERFNPLPQPTACGDAPLAATNPFPAVVHDLTGASPSVQSNSGTGPHQIGFKQAPDDDERSLQLPPAGGESAAFDASRTHLHSLSAQLDAAHELQRQTEGKLERALHAAAELADARWEILTLRADFLRGKDATADALARAAEAEDRATAATAERDQLRTIVLSLERDLEQERLNVAAIDHRYRIAEQRADENDGAAAEQARAEAERDATVAQLRATEIESRDFEEQLHAAEDRAMAAEASLRRTELRALASEDQARTIQAQWESTQERLQATAKELAARRKQILRLREQLGRRLILPFGRMQRRLDDLTKVPPSC